MFGRRFPVYVSLYLTLFSCVKDSDFNTPPLRCENEVTANASFESLLEAYHGKPDRIDQDLLFPAYVISSDRAGNFYKKLYLQADPTDPKCSGIEIGMDLPDLYLDYPPGTKLLIQAKGLYMDGKDGLFQLGPLQRDSSGKPRLGRIDINDIHQRIHFSCDSPHVITPSTYTHIEKAKADVHVNTLVQLDGVEFDAQDTAKTYADRDGDANRRLVDGFGGTLIVRSSHYADFAKQPLPDGSGSIEGVMSKYGRYFELHIRSLSDVQLDKPRFEDKSEAKSEGESRDESGYKRTADFPCKTPTNGSYTELCSLHRRYTGEDIQLGKIKIKVIVTSDSKAGNIYSRNVAVQDETAGIILNFNTLPMFQPSGKRARPGDVIEVNLLGSTLSDYHGLLEISTQCANVVRTRTGVAVTPKYITIAQLNTNYYESMLVQLDKVTYEKPNYPFYSGSDSGSNHTLHDATGTTCVRVLSGTKFGNRIVPEGQTCVTGNAGIYNGKAQLLPRNASDVTCGADQKKTDHP